MRISLAFPTNGPSGRRRSACSGRRRHACRPAGRWGATTGSPAGRAHQRSRPRCPVLDSWRATCKGCPAPAAAGRRQHVLRGFETRNRQAQQVASTRNTFQRDGSRLAQRLDHRVELCNGPSALTKVPEVSERGNRQQHVADVHVGLERAENVTTISTGGQARLATSGGIARARVEQQHSTALQRTAQHLAGVQAPAPGNADELRAHRVGGLGQEAHGGTGLLANPVGQRQQLSLTPARGGRPRCPAAWPCVRRPAGNGRWPRQPPRRLAGCRPQ